MEIKPLIELPSKEMGTKRPRELPADISSSKRVNANQMTSNMIDLKMMVLPFICFIMKPMHIFRSYNLN